jgi:hypothetical protein
VARAGAAERGKDTTMNRSGLFVAAVAALALGSAACGLWSTDSRTVSSSAGGAAGMCAEGQPDCVDTPQLNDGEPVAMDKTGIRQSRRDAKFYLGRKQSELNELIRIARIDDEQFMLTEDYRIGRITVELDDIDDNGKPIVTSATVELPDGPETFKLQK